LEKNNETSNVGCTCSTNFSKWTSESNSKVKWQELEGSQLGFLRQGGLQAVGGVASIDQTGHGTALPAKQV